MSNNRNAKLPIKQKRMEAFVDACKSWLHNPYHIVLLVLLCLHIFLRFYEIDKRLSFGYDQLDSAWAAKNILINHSFPLLGPANKLGSGIYIGPLYYYLITFFYALTNLDPIAAGIFAGITSIFSFVLLYAIAKKIFSERVALIAVFINTVSLSAIGYDRNQWEINFIPPVSLLIFYLLYKTITEIKKDRYIPWLLFALGATTHIHFTILFFLSLITFLTLPLWLTSRNTIKRTVMSLPLYLIWIIPIAIGYAQTVLVQYSKPVSYAQSVYLGIHAVRFLQIIPRDIFIQVESFFPLQQYWKFVLIPLFLFVYIRKKKLTRTTVIFSLLFILWFLVPPVVFSTFRGEITDYYYSVNRFLGLLAGAYLIGELWTVQFPILAIAIVAFGIIYAQSQIRMFLDKRIVGLHNWRVITQDAIAKGKRIEFAENSPSAYLYYIFTRRTQKPVLK